MKRLLLLGGGHAHVEVLRRLALQPAPQVEVTLVTPRPELLYTGMLPGCIAGHYTRAEIAIDLDRLATKAGANLILAHADRIDPERREVHCAGAAPVGYDILSCDIGSRPQAGAAGVGEHAIVVRPLENALAGFEKLLERASGGGVRAVSVVGGGAGGVELAFAMRHRFQEALRAQAPQVAIVTDAPHLLPDFPQRARSMLGQCMAHHGIELHAGSAVAEVGPDFLRLQNATILPTDATVWAAGAGAHPLFREAGLATDDRGFLAVNDRLQSVSHANVFGAGDCATTLSDPRPKAGVFAVRAGPWLDRNLRAALAGDALAAWTSRRNYLALLSTGERHAIGTWGPVAWSGAWAWRWKDRIDRVFIARYR